MQDSPILYSFRRCPYAIRARLALLVSQQVCEMREVILRDRPKHMLQISPKGTVPVLLLSDGTVIEESLDIMLWTLDNSDPHGWLESQSGNMQEMLSLITMNDDDFKQHLDRYKYPDRYEEQIDKAQELQEAQRFLDLLENRLSVSSYLFGSAASLADIAIVPFIRQFANTDRNWFDAAPYPKLQAWLDVLLNTESFTQCMQKYPQWHEGDAVELFP